MTNPRRYQKRRDDIRRRIATSSPDYGRCRIFECDQMTTAAKGKGLNRLYCRRHVDHFRRHGSYFKASYRVAELRPYRQVALRWLKENDSDPVVRQAVEAVRHLYWRAGPPQEAFRLAGRSPDERAKYAWARLRERGVDPREVLAAWLTVEMRILDDMQPDRHREFKLVQVAKLIHRMAGGSHKRWEHESGDPKRAMVLHKHPASRGLLLRRLGEDLSKAGELTNAYFACKHAAQA